MFLTGNLHPALHIEPAISQTESVDCIWGKDHTPLACSDQEIKTNSIARQEETTMADFPKTPWTLPCSKTPSN